MITLDTERLFNLLSRKLNLLEEILAYSQEQHGLLYQRNHLKYNNLIESRAKCLDDLAKLEVVLERNLNRFNQTNATDGSFQEKLYVINSNITATLKKILELDKSNKENMLKERSELKAKMQNVRQGRKGIAGYKENNRFSPAGIFTDNKG